jgi:DNA-binding MarR family transcriptional regulator
VKLEQVETLSSVGHPGRGAAWLTKQVEIGLGAVELSVSQYRILGILAEGSAMSSSLAERLAVRPPSVTSVIDGLVTRGLVERRPSENDRRKITLGITDLGRNVLESADEAVDNRLNEVVSMLDEPSAKQALEALDLWQQAIRAYRQAAGVKR